MCGRHVVERVACDRAYGYAVDEHVGDLVLGVRGDGEGLARAVVDNVRSCGRNRTVQACCCCECERVDRECRTDRVCGYDIVERVAVERADRCTVDEYVGDIVSYSRRNVEGLAVVVVDGDAAGRVDRTVGACGRSDNVRIDCEIRSHRDCPVNVGTCCACDAVAP